MSISDTLPNNLSRQYNILQHCLVHSSECAVARSLNSRTFLWWPQCPPGGNQDHILQGFKGSKITRISTPLTLIYILKGKHACQFSTAYFSVF